MKAVKKQPQPILLGYTLQNQADMDVQGGYVSLLGEPFYKIHHYDAMEPFFMSIVSGSDHWLFISSTGGLTAGRGSAEQSIFPYYTVDKITENEENTGPKAIFLVTRSDRTSLWEPFSERLRGCYAISRNLYKNGTGTALVFEEQNHDLGLTYRYAWRTSERFGFVKTAWLINRQNSPCAVELLDGLQNILPANITSVTQNTFGSLLDAYKRSEVDPSTGLAIFALNSRLTDLAEPSESLTATSVAQVGLSPAGYLISSTQLDSFRAGHDIVPETEVRGQRGAYFVHAAIALAPQEERSWYLMVDVQQDSAALIRMVDWLRGDQATRQSEIEQDIAAGQLGLWKVVASADGVQLSNNPLISNHHFANVMFNSMRGGIFVDGYGIQAPDFIEFVTAHNRPLLQDHPAFFAALPTRLLACELQARAKASGSPDLIRLGNAFLPLAFSRRHGDPSRPWNRFAINLKKPDGSLKIDYEGNWRDIFQNWEALAYSYPEFIESMISTFLNATTVDGYNPYRITHHGLDWELPEPGNPWANIGYWSDHQIIYLQKLMEISLKLHPGSLPGSLDHPAFSYAHVPYRIKPYNEMLADSYKTIDVDWDLERQIETSQKNIGSDAKLVRNPDGQIIHTSLAEKLLTLLLAKLANFVPEGGIWMNTQRPEWNDANNALVGKGLSVVTLGYLRRYLAFCQELFTQSGLAFVSLSAEVNTFYRRVSSILGEFQPILQGAFNDEQRRAMLDALGNAGSDYRWNFYQHGLSGDQGQAPVTEMVSFLDLAQRFVEHSLRANRRDDHLYHAYNILHLENGRASISHLYEMLEGQVSILSSGLLSEEESIALLESLRNSSLYRADQHSYILYPDRNLPGFLQKNCLDRARVADIALFALLEEDQDRSIVTRDSHGVYHFSGHIRNFQDVRQSLDDLKKNPRYSPLIESESEKIRALFEDTFHHDEFTGRSGTFFAYEGLGSVYWHMVSKLLLAVQETTLRYRRGGRVNELKSSYLDIRQGLGFNKKPEIYGAFPTDPYSHTPKGQGAKQPGMTGMVKEEILTRQAELGLTIQAGKLVFDNLLVDPGELLTAPADFPYLDVNGQEQVIALHVGSLAYTFCQTPIVLETSTHWSLTVALENGKIQEVEGNTLDESNSRHIFLRDGQVKWLRVSFPTRVG